MSWQPSASMAALKERAHFYSYIRDFFNVRDVLEVETPLLSSAAVSDANLLPMALNCLGKSRYLHTSPEYPMKRLLASGSGDIYQICKVFRDEELGKRHNPEFSMLEFYRLNFNLPTLQDEVAQLVGDYLKIQKRLDLSYRQALIKYADIDPFLATDEELARQVEVFVGSLKLTRDECLDIVMSHTVEPALPKDSLVFIFGYPASQAALAQTYENENGELIAQRFELYVNGLELANGYQELTDIQEQKSRFDFERAKNVNAKGLQRPMDLHFLDALQHGLPECSGVALGLDRILMLKLEKQNVREVLSFGFNEA
ncbi:MAG: EF-P lysine aminoacylase EpmA [Bermanella sp.]